MRSSRGRRGGWGQSTVEFALGLPIFLLAVAALLEGARAVYANAALTHAVHEGGRVAALARTVDEDAVKTAVNRSQFLSLPRLNVPTADVTVAVNGSDGTTKLYTARLPGDRVRVTARYSYRPIFFGLWPNGAAVVLSGATEPTPE